MILTCPSCHTRYTIDPATLGPQGRTVRCAKCAHTWTQMPPDLPAEAPGAEVPADKAPEDESPADAMPADAIAADETPAPIAEPASPPESPPLRTLPGRGGRAKRSGARGWLVALMALVVVAGLGAVVVLERAAVVARFPPLAPLFAALGLALPDPLAGLRIVDARNEWITEGETVVVVVRGTIVNDGDRAVAVPAVRGIFRDAAHGELASWTFAPDADRLLPGQSVSFLDRFADPPEGAVDLAVVLVPGS